MITKYIEVRDNMTLMPAKVEIINDQNPIETKFYRYCGYGLEHIGFYTFLTFIETGECNYDPFKWSNSRIRELHKWLRSHFDELESGQVVDIRVILGESETPVSSEM